MKALESVFNISLLKVIKGVKGFLSYPATSTKSVKSIYEHLYGCNKSSWNLLTYLYYITLADGNHWWKPIAFNIRLKVIDLLSYPATETNYEKLHTAAIVALQFVNLLVLYYFGWWKSLMETYSFQYQIKGYRPLVVPCYWNKLWETAYGRNSRPAICEPTSIIYTLDDKIRDENL